MILTILSHMTAVWILLAIGITCIVLPIFFYKVIKKGNMNTAAKISVACGVIMCIPTVYYFYLDMRYDVSGFTAEDKLVLAVENNNMKVAYAQLDDGADCEKRSRYGISAIYRAAELGNSEFVKLFLQSGADPNYTCGKDITLLSVACRNQDNSTVRALLEAGADPDYKIEKFVPAIHYAAAYDKDYNAELVEMLMAAGADPASKSSSNGKIMLPYRYYYNEYKYDKEITEEDEMNFGMIREMLYESYIEWLTVKLEAESDSK